MSTPWLTYAIAGAAGIGAALLLRSALPVKPGPIITVVFENKSRSQVMGIAPYLTSLAASNVDLTNYVSLIQPSLPNYIQMVTGTTGGITDDTGHVLPGNANLAQQMDEAGITWRSYTDGTNTPCDRRYHGTYMPRHVPFLYLENVVSRPDYCAEHVVPLEPYFWQDLANNSVRFMYVTPDAQNDMHDTSVAFGDAWASEFIGRIIASPTFQRSGVLFVLFDERGSGNHTLAAILASPKLKTPGVPYDGRVGHLSYLATVEDLLWLPRLPAVTNEPSMAGLLNF